MKRPFYMPLEIKNRDFYSRLLISLEICNKNNYDIYFGYRGDVNYFAKNYVPGVYYGLTTLRNFDKLNKSLKDNGNIIIISDEEGLVTYSPKYYKKFKVSKKCLEIADLIFTWGKKNSLLLSKICKNKNKIIITGNPRLDLLKKPISNIYLSEVQKIKKKYGKFYLIATNFSYTNYFDKKISYTKLLKKRDFFQSASDLVEWKKYLEIKQLIFNEIIKFIKKSKGLNLVIRCHPSENEELYKDLEKKYKNVHFEKSYSLHPWILASDGVISHYCTSTFEALAANKKAYNLKPNYKTLLEDKSYFKIPIVAKNHQELIDKINQKNIKNNNTSQLKYYSQNLDNKFYSYKKIANEISKISLNGYKHNLPKYFIVKFQLLNILEKLKNIILLRRNNYIEHKIQNISKKEILSFINFFPKFKNQFNIIKLNKNFFLISKK